VSEAVKPFHELTQEEFATLVELGGMTWDECAKQYPQPEWCNYPMAVHEMGCWSLMLHRVTGLEFCVGCELCSEKEVSDDPTPRPPAAKEDSH
jgi:hypothetical protein